MNHLINLAHGKRFISRICHMNTPKSLLEAYLQAKDLNQPSVILDCFTRDAVLTYSIATDTISFPARVDGADAIAQVLVRDFGKGFDSCRLLPLDVRSR